MNTQPIVLLAGKGTSTQIVYNYLSNYFLFDEVIIEEAVPTKTFLKKRIKKLGFIKVVGQILFQATVVKWLNFLSKKRVNEILHQYSLNNTPIEVKKITEVNSVNDEICLQLLQKINPAIIVVNGTRIISKKILTATNAKIINMHAGITPAYRGVHGAYWALVKKDAANCGVTVHFVDAGIDTGSVIAQKKIDIAAQDNFTTYPLIQLAHGLPLLKAAIEDIQQNKITTFIPALPSALWSHPTIWQYLSNRIFKGIR